MPRRRLLFAALAAYIVWLAVLCVMIALEGRRPEVRPTTPTSPAPIPAPSSPALG
jgi:hypothetical protein